MGDCNRVVEYAFVGHESAVEANRAIARGLVPVLPCPDVMALPEPEFCVTNQKKFKALAREVDLEALGLTGRPVHLIVPYAAARSSGRLARFHVWGDIVPGDAFVRVHERLFVSSPLFTVLQLACARRPTSLTKQQVQDSMDETRSVRSARGLPVSAVSGADLLAWENIRAIVEAARVLTEFAGSYRMPSRPGESVAYDLEAALTCDSVASTLGALPILKGAERAQRIVCLAFDGSASPMETMLVLILTLPVELGGYGLPRPRLNVRIAVEPDELRFCSKDKMVVDLYWDEARLVLEYDSGEFHAEKGRGKRACDTERANSLTALGYQVLSATYELVRDSRRLDLLARQIAHKLGVELATPDGPQSLFRARLHALLLPPVNELW